MRACVVLRYRLVVALLVAGWCVSGFSRPVVSSDELVQFLGGAEGKLVYVRFAEGEWKESGKEIWYIDITRGGDLTPRLVVRENLETRSPMISPDGNWITYNTYETPSENHLRGRAAKCYIVPLRENGGNARIEVGDGGQPRWWYHPVTGDHYIIYNEYDLEDGWQMYWQEYGNTNIRKVNAVTRYPEGGTQTLIARYANGGRSMAGGYLFTSGRATGIYRIDPHATANARIYEERNFGFELGCNPSISPHTNDADVVVMHNGASDQSSLGYEGHTYFVIRRVDGTIVRAVHIEDVTNDENFYWDTPEWSTHVDYATVVGSPADLAPPYDYDIYLYRISDNTAIKVMDGNFHWPHLWVDPNPVGTGQRDLASFPHPPRYRIHAAQGAITVTAQGRSSFRARLFDSRGVCRAQTSGGGGRAAFTNVGAGVYLVEVVSGQGSAALSVILR